jgi:LysR family transcriptional regulator, glycine cleavage system transcriptional activator
MTLQLSLAALRAVEAAARQRSYTLAARELHITHSAVSHQVRQVESHLGTTLFTRVRTQMVPTPACEQLVVRLRRALDEIDAALRQTAAHDKTETVPLYLSVMADFANVWLIRRIGDFTQRYPNKALALSIHTGLEPPNPNSFDIGVWHRRVDTDGFRSMRLPRDRVIAVCSAEFARRYPTLSLKSLPAVPLLRFAGRSWGEFFQAAGVEADEPVSGLIFTDAGALLSGALAGQGVAMIRRQMAEAELRTGSLVQVGDVEIEAHLDYFISWRVGHPREPDIESFRDWLCAQLVSTPINQTAKHSKS